MYACVYVCMYVKATTATMRVREEEEKRKTESKLSHHDQHLLRALGSYALHISS